MVSKSEQHPSPNPIVILRRHVVEARTGLSRSTIYLRMAQGLFPKSIPLGPRAVGWVESEIQGWLEKNIAARRLHVDEPRGARNHES